MFKRKDQLSEDVLWRVFLNVCQSISRFNVSDPLIVNVHFFKMTAVFGRCATKTGGRPLSVMTHLKKSIVEVKTEENCLAQAPLIAISRVNNVPKNNSFCRGFRLRHLVKNLLETTGFDLTNGAGIPELVSFR